MTNAVISYVNYADQAGLFIDDGPTEPGYPVSHLKLRQLSSTCRFGDTLNPANIRIDFGVTRAPRLIGLLNCNWRVSDGSGPKMRIDYWNGFTFVAAATLSLTDPVGFRHQRHALIVLPSPISAQIWRIQPLWTLGGTHDPFFEAGRVWAGNALILPKSIQAKWTSDIDDSGVLAPSADRQYWEDPGVRARVLRCTARLSTMEAYGFNEDDSTAADVPSIDDLRYTVGRTGEVIVIPRAQSPLWINRTAIYGHFSKPPPLPHEAGPNYTTTFDVVQER